MSEDIGASGASVLVSGHMSDRMSSRIAVVGGRRRWSVEQKLVILREAFGPDGSVSATCQRHAVGSGIELPSGVRLTVDAAVDADALARVMSVLAR